MVLHTINTYREANRPIDPDLPEDAVRRLPDGRFVRAPNTIRARVWQVPSWSPLRRARSHPWHRLLMRDGSIGKDTTGLPHNLHKEKAHKELALDRAYRLIKESV